MRRRRDADERRFIFRETEKASTTLLQPRIPRPHPEPPRVVEPGPLAYHPRVQLFVRGGDDAVHVRRPLRDCGAVLVGGAVRIRARATRPGSRRAAPRPRTCPSASCPSPGTPTCPPGRPASSPPSPPRPPRGGRRRGTACTRRPPRKATGATVSSPRVGFEIRRSRFHHRHSSVRLAAGIGKDPQPGNTPQRPSFAEGAGRKRLQVILRVFVFALGFPALGGERAFARRAPRRRRHRRRRLPVDPHEGLVDHARHRDALDGDADQNRHGAPVLGALHELARAVQGVHPNRHVALGARGGDGAKTAPVSSPKGRLQPKVARRLF